MSIMKTRLLRLALCFSMLGCFVLLTPLSAYDCGCAGDCDYNCECGIDCECEADDYSDECETDCEAGCDADADEDYDEDEDEERHKDCYSDCNPCGCFIDGITVGIDFLYWNPCVSGLHYAVKQTDHANASYEKYDYHYICAKSESGFRVNLASQFTMEGVSFKAAYTDVGYSDKACTSSQTPDSLRLSQGSPLDNLPLDYVTAYWEMKYQTIEAALVYTLDLETLVVTPYVGVDVLLLDNKIQSKGSDSFGEVTATVASRKHQQYFGAGPMLGFGANFGVSDSLSAFFDVNASLFIGGAEENDRFDAVVDSIERVEWDRRYKSKDCYCFPGWHLMFGLGYETSLCGLDVGLRFGYEFVQYTNVPWFTDYELGGLGVVSSDHANNLTLRGLFVGVNVGF
jgi:Legionella pneumophila major outer membrane protein precursor